MLKRLIVLSRRSWRLLCNAGVLHRVESALVGCAALHVAAISHHTTEAVTNFILGLLMLIVLLKQIKGTDHG